MVLFIVAGSRFDGGSDRLLACVSHLANANSPKVHSPSLPQRINGQQWEGDTCPVGLTVFSCMHATSR